MERARSRLARNGGLDEVGVLQASRLQEELTRREVRRASEAAAAAKKNARLRLKREKKAAQRREELRQARQREYDRGAVYLPPVLEPPKTPPGPTEQEVGEEWRAAREEVAGLLPADWGSHHADRVQWCLGWLAHTDKRRRVSALHSLHAFLSPAIDAEFGVEQCRDGVDRLIAAHAGDIAGHLRRSLAAAAAASSRCVEERLLAVMVAGLVLLWSKESCAIVREKLLDVLARHTRVGRTDDDGDSDGNDSQAEPERVRGHHDVVNPDDLRAAAVEMLGVMQFLHYYGTEPAEGADGDGDAEDPVVALIETTFTRLCADDHRTPAIVRATALSVIGLLGTLLPAPCLASWLDTNVELVLGFLRHDDISMRLAGADALLVFLAAIHDDLAFDVDDAGDGDDDEAGVEAELLSAVPGQHELFQLRSRLEEMVKARDRRASKADNKALRSLVERLLKLLHALARRTDQLKARNADNGDDEDDNDNDDEDEDDDDEEEEEEYIVGRGSPRLQVMLRPMGRNDNGYWSPGVQPELAVYSERHRKQLEAVMALTGPSLRLYLHGGGLAELVACVVDENELVARVKPSPDSDDDDYHYPREPKGTNVSKGKHPSVVFGDWEAHMKVANRRINYSVMQRMPYGSMWGYRHAPGRGVVGPDPSLLAPNPNMGVPRVTDSRLPEELLPITTGGRYARVIVQKTCGRRTKRNY